MASQRYTQSCILQLGPSHAGIWLCIAAPLQCANHRCIHRGPARCSVTLVLQAHAPWPTPCATCAPIFSMAPIRGCLLRVCSRHLWLHGTTWRHAWQRVAACGSRRSHYMTLETCVAARGSVRQPTVASHDVSHGKLLTLCVCPLMMRPLHVQKRRPKTACSPAPTTLHLSSR